MACILHNRNAHTNIAYGGNKMTNPMPASTKINKSIRENNQVYRYLFFIFPMALFLLFSCSQFDNPLGPVDDENTNGAPNFLTNITNSLEKGGHGGKGGPPGPGEAWITETKRINAKKGGTVGGKKTNNNRVIIPPGALKKDTKISVSVPIKSEYIFAEFGPSYTFKIPVTIEISYANADLSNVNEDNLSIWFFDKNGNWTKVISIVDKKRKVIIALVKHFSRYALSDD